MTLHKKAGLSLRAVELDIGDELFFTLKNGITHRIKLIESKAKIVETNKEDLSVFDPVGGTLYKIEATLEFDGFTLPLRRFIGAQETFAEPIKIAGMCIWFDANTDIFNLIHEDHGVCSPTKRVRLAVWDMEDDICPEEIDRWCELYGDETLYIEKCYCGDDCFLGAYMGSQAHGGLDVDHPEGTPIYAPISFDDQYYYNAVAYGDVNNRWQGVRHWADGTIWMLAVAHMGSLTVEEHTSVKAGEQIAIGAQVYCGRHTHSHFIFELIDDNIGYMLDPWLIFRSYFVKKAEKDGKLNVKINAPISISCGEKINLSASSNKSAEIYWDLGDNSGKKGESITHIFSQSGIYAIRVVAVSGEEKSEDVLYITVNGSKPATAPFFKFTSDEKGFDLWPLERTRTHLEIDAIPRVFSVKAFENLPRKFSKIIKFVCNNFVFNKDELKISGDSELVSKIKILNVENEVKISFDSEGLQKGIYNADFTYEDIGGTNYFGIKLEVLPSENTDEKIITYKDSCVRKVGFEWVAHRFQMWDERRGETGSYLTNGGSGKKGARVVFEPLLTPGVYEVYFSGKTPFKEETQFNVLVNHDKGRNLILAKPKESLFIGEFHFGNKDNKITLKGTKTTVFADALIFKKKM